MTDPRVLREFTERTGLIICEVCCEARPREDMQPVEGEPDNVWDICRECAPSCGP